MCLFAICKSNLVKGLFISCVHFQTELFDFLLSSFERSLYILGTNPFVEYMVWIFFIFIFFQSVACLFILSTGLL